MGIGVDSGKRVAPTGRGRLATGGAQRNPWIEGGLTIVPPRRGEGAWRMRPSPAPAGAVW